MFPLVATAKVFEFFNREVTKANSYQTKEVFSVSQELLSVLDGERVVVVVVADLRHGTAVCTAPLSPT